MLKELTTYEPGGDEQSSACETLIPVVFAKGNDEGRRYQSILAEAGISATLAGDAFSGPPGLGLPVLVPESLYEPASEMIASTDAADSDHGFDDDDKDDAFPDDADDDEDDDDLDNDDFDED